MTDKTPIKKDVFAHLRAAVAGESKGEPLQIKLDDIDEDPHQPRRVFDHAALEELAATIKEHGVLQPVVVAPPQAGRYQLRFGARRLRSARLAGLTTIPAYVRAKDDNSYTAQIIENQHRAALSNSDLAAAITALSLAEKTRNQIAGICKLSDHEVKAFRAVVNMPDELKARLDNSDIRALNELNRQWAKTPQDVIAALPAPDEYLSITDARRIITGITGKPSGNFPDGNQSGPAETAAHEDDTTNDDTPPSLVGNVPINPGELDGDYSRHEAEKDQEDEPAPLDFGRSDGAGANEKPAPSKPATRKPALIVMLDDGREARLMMESPDQSLVGETLRLQVLRLE